MERKWILLELIDCSTSSSSSSRDEDELLNNALNKFLAKVGDILSSSDDEFLNMMNPLPRSIKHRIVNFVADVYSEEEVCLKCFLKL